MSAKPRKGSNQDRLAKAIQELQENKISLRAAAAKYDVPRSTLYNYTSGKTMLGATSGPNPVLTKEEEQELVDWALKMATIGYGQTRRQLAEIVRCILEHTKRPNPFTDN